MRLAGRIAAATMLGNRFAVWTGPEVDCPREDIPVSALAGSREDGDFAVFIATDDDVREVLDTGLFSSRGEHRMGWAHQGYGEFLAALYLFERGVPAETLLKALRHPARRLDSAAFGRRCVGRLVEQRIARGPDRRRTHRAS